MTNDDTPSSFLERADEEAGAASELLMQIRGGKVKGGLQNRHVAAVRADAHASLAHYWLARHVEEAQSAPVDDHIDRMFGRTR